MCRLSHFGPPRSGKPQQTRNLSPRLREYASQTRRCCNHLPRWAAVNLTSEGRYCMSLRKGWSRHHLRSVIRSRRERCRRQRLAQEFRQPFCGSRGEFSSFFDWVGLGWNPRLRRKIPDLIGVQFIRVHQLRIGGRLARREISQSKINLVCCAQTERCHARVYWNYPVRISIALGA